MIDITEHGDSTPAPGDLEVLQRFINLHDHDAEGRTIPPPAEMLRAFLVGRGLITEKERFTEADRETALRLAQAFRALIRTNEDEPLGEDEVRVIDDASERAGLHPHFAYGDPVLVPARGGTAGAFGELVAIAFLARFDGTWEHLKECANDDCRATFFDRSKNHSGKWCSMESCGNRAKVRAWRERQRAVR
jgi:hypothetical protein